MPFHFANVLLFSATAILSFSGRCWPRISCGQRSTREKSMILRVRREAHRPGLVSIQSALLPDRPGFVIFEVEIAFMFPVASVYKSFIERARGCSRSRIFVFVAILAVGLAYVWAMGDLEWVKGLKQTCCIAARRSGRSHRTFREEAA